MTFNGALQMIRKSVGLSSVSASSVLSKRLRSALLSGNSATFKPSALKIVRTGKNDYRVVIVDELGQELAQILEFKNLNIGDSVTMMDIDRVFEIKIT